MAENAGWIRASHSPVVPGTKVHAMALTPLVLWTVWWSWFTLAFTLAVVTLSAALEIKGRRPGWLIARQRSRLRGHWVVAAPYWYVRRRSRLQSYSDLTLKQAWDAEALSAEVKAASARMSASRNS